MFGSMVMRSDRVMVRIVAEGLQEIILIFVHPSGFNIFSSLDYLHTLENGFLLLLETSSGFWVRFQHPQQLFGCQNRGPSNMVQLEQIHTVPGDERIGLTLHRNRNDEVIVWIWRHEWHASNWHKLCFGVDQVHQRARSSVGQERPNPSVSAGAPELFGLLARGQHCEAAFVSPQPY